jgi:hypothetical protein
MAPPSATLFPVALKLDPLVLIHIYISIVGTVVFQAQDTHHRPQHDLGYRYAAFMTPGGGYQPSARTAYAFLC